MYNYFLSYFKVPHIYIITAVYKPSNRSGYIGLYLEKGYTIFENTIFCFDTVVNCKDVEDPLFPLSEIISFSSHSSHSYHLFSKCFETAINNYIMSKNSSIYNIEIYKNYEIIYFRSLKKINQGEEFLIYKGIDYWLIEVLKYISENFLLLEIWLKIVLTINKKHFQNNLNIINRLIEDVTWKLNFKKNNPNFKGKIPKLHIEDL